MKLEDVETRIMKALKDLQETYRKFDETSAKKSLAETEYEHQRAIEYNKLNVDKMTETQKKSLVDEKTYEFAKQFRVLRDEVEVLKKGLAVQHAVVDGCRSLIASKRQ